MSGERKEGCCALCGEEWQPAHFGNPRKCAFEGETFSGNNWNCGLVSTIRSAMYDNEDEQWALRIRFDDQSFAALFVAIPDSDLNTHYDYELMGLLVGSWYKDRGACDELKWGIQDRGTDGEELTREQAVKIAAHLKAQGGEGA